MRPQTQLSRCFIQPIEEPPENNGGGRGGKRKCQTWRDAMLPEIIEALKPWAHPELVFDIETTTDAHSGQRAKVGFWQDRGLIYADRCNLFAQGKLTQEAMDVRRREGVLYNVKTCTKADIKQVEAYAAKHNLAIMEMADFIKKVFYRQAKLNAHIPEPKMIIGHNPVFDFGSLSRHTGKACDEKLYGAVSLGLCNCREADEVGGKRFMACGYHPNIKIKKLGPAKHIMKCGLKYDGRGRSGKPKYVDMCLEFLDTRQLAGALLGARCDKSLGALCRMLKTATQKGTDADHGKEITEEYLDYARKDVQCTWELFVKLRDLYKLWGLKKRITKLYSEANIGKGVYEELGILSFSGSASGQSRTLVIWTLTRNCSACPWRACSAVEAKAGTGM